MLRNMGDRLGHESSHDATPPPSPFDCNSKIVLHPSYGIVFSPSWATQNLRFPPEICPELYLLDDHVWLQATLSIKFGGYGIVRATHLAHIFFASAAACWNLTFRILLPAISPSSDPRTFRVAERFTIHESLHLQKALEFRGGFPHFRLLVGCLPWLY